MIWCVAWGWGKSEKERWGGGSDAAWIWCSRDWPWRQPYHRPFLLSPFLRPYPPCPDSHSHFSMHSLHSLSTYGYSCYWLINYYYYYLIWKKISYTRHMLSGWKESYKCFLEVVYLIFFLLIFVSIFFSKKKREYYFCFSIILFYFKI